MCAAVAIRTPWQFGDRSAKTNTNGVVLPKVEVLHPNKKLGDISALNLQGGSCASPSNSAPRQSSAPRLSDPAPDPRPPASSPTAFLPQIPDGIAVEVAKDRTKVHLPIFGNARVSSRIENRLTSQNNETGRNDRLTLSQLEKSIRDKLSSSYLTVKNVFQSHDAEGRGKVSREQLSRILSQCLATNVTLSQFNRLMKSLGLDDKNYVTFDEFYQLFNTKQEPGSEYPSWFFQDGGCSEQGTASKVHTYLKQEAKKDADKLLISLGMLGDEKIIKPEFADALKRIGYDLGEEEFEKLWKKYDDSGTGVVDKSKFLIKLTQNQKNTEKSKKEKPRERQIGIERWLTKKFRTAFRDMQHAFREAGSDDGTVSRDQFLRVLREFGLMLKSGQLDTFLGRCNLHTGPRIDYKGFLRIFQSRGENGIGGQILRNPGHKYHRAESVASCVSNVSDIEGVLFDMFHADFLKLLTKFQRIDQAGKGTVSIVEFRACLESFFGGEISDSIFNDLLKSVRKDSNGRVDYQSFLSKFDCDDSKTIFDSVSSLGDADDRNYFLRSQASTSLSSPCSRQSALSAGPPAGGERGVAQLSAEIKAKVNGDFQLVADVFHDLDEKNTKRMNAEVLHKLLTKLGVAVTSQEANALYKHILTDQNGTLEFSQFVRHFGFSIKSAVYPNAKRNPPTRGDSDFRMLSHRFNSSKELVEDCVKTVVEQREGEVTQQFLSVDKAETGTVGEADFKRVLVSLCPDLTLQEQKMLVTRFGVSSGVSWRKFMAKMCPPKLVRRSTDVIVPHESEEE